MEDFFINPELQYQLQKKKKYVYAWRQVCIYSLPYKSLKVFSSTRKKTPLESMEDCELLRFFRIRSRNKNDKYV